MIQFKKIIIHNFGSYGYAELDLQNKGFCLVSGQNNCTKDNALSNGSGKSFLWSAICFAITGETLNGVKTNLKNINTDDPTCYTQVEFLYNKDLISIKRSAAPKTDLKIYKNKKDVSGKGIRESERQLQELIPELTKDLITSVIIIGQGMPNKFSSFSPSGRKELLEKLTNSDFMIEDIKQRIQERYQVLSAALRETEDNLLVNNTSLTGYSKSLETLKTELANQCQPDFNEELLKLKEELILLKNNSELLQHQLNQAEAVLENLNAELLTITEEKNKVSNEELTAYNSSYTQILSEETALKTKITGLKEQIVALQNITDVCPTCGQRLPNVKKPSTLVQEQNVETLNEALSNQCEKKITCNKKHKDYLAQINLAFNARLTQLSAQVTAKKQEIYKLRDQLQKAQTNFTLAKENFDSLSYKKQTWESNLVAQKNEIIHLENEITNITNIIFSLEASKTTTELHLQVVKKMTTLAKRDFRGYLLTNIITFIDKKAKEYCNIVFGTKELSLALNGNALEITYCNKPFDGLSGGEKQRVDLILQLAIRELLIAYLGTSANILVLDEITDFLDKQSCQAVMNLLENKLQDVESVFIISHHAGDLDIPVDSEITIIKNNLGISEIY